MNETDASTRIRVTVGADSRGLAIAHHVVDVLEQSGQVVTLCAESATSTEAASSDYPDQAWLVAQAIGRGEADWGVLVSGSGIGMCMTANKCPGIRAVLAHDEWIVRRARAHHDCNVMCIAADLVGLPFVKTVVELWLATSFEGGRHERRVRKIAAVERGEDPRNVNHHSDADT